MPDFDGCYFRGAGIGGAAYGSSQAQPGYAARCRNQEIGGSESMTWSMFYLVCFLVGVTLSVLSFLGGSLPLPHVHLPRLHLSHATAAHAGVGHPGTGRG